MSEREVGRPRGMNVPPPPLHRPPAFCDNVHSSTLPSSCFKLVATSWMPPSCPPTWGWYARNASRMGGTRGRGVSPDRAYMPPPPVAVGRGGAGVEVDASTLPTPIDVPSRPALSAARHRASSARMAHTSSCGVRGERGGVRRRHGHSALWWQRAGAGT